MSVEMWRIKKSWNNFLVQFHSNIFIFKLENWEKILQINIVQFIRESRIIIKEWGLQKKKKMIKKE